MGIVTMSIPADTTLFLRDTFNCNVLVETGTYLGGTATWAAEYFEQVHTLEFSKEIFDITSQKYGHIKNIHFYYGDTKTQLEKIIPKDRSFIVWLDAHWCAGMTYGEHDQCPLLDEIDILNQLDNDCFIMIDDARLFLVPPPLPHNLNDYPDISQVVYKLNEKDRFVAVYQDVIFGIPAKYGKQFRAYLQAQVSQPTVPDTGKKTNKRYIKKIVDRAKNKISKVINPPKA